MPLPDKKSRVALQRDSDEAKFFFDAVMNRSYKRTLTATQHPVEGTGQITDHIQRDVRDFTLDAKVSQADLKRPVGSPVVGSEEDDPLQDIGNVFQEASREVELETGQPVIGSQNRKRTALAINFFEASEEQIVHVLNLRYGAILNCAILDWSYDVTIDKRLSFNLKMRRLVFAESQDVLIPPEVPPAGKANNMASTTREGKRGPEGQAPSKNTSESLTEKTRELSELEESNEAGAVAAAKGVPRSEVDADVSASGPGNF